MAVVGGLMTASQPLCLELHLISPFQQPGEVLLSLCRDRTLRQRKPECITQSSTTSKRQRENSNPKRSEPKALWGACPRGRRVAEACDVP